MFLNRMASLIVLISDNTIWRFTNFALDRGYPKNISDMPEQPRAATFIRDQYGITRLLIYGVRYPSLRVSFYYVLFDCLSFWCSLISYLLFVL